MRLRTLCKHLAELVIYVWCIVDEFSGEVNGAAGGSGMELSGNGEKNEVIRCISKNGTAGKKILYYNINPQII